MGQIHLSGPLSGFLLSKAVHLVPWESPCLCKKILFYAGQTVLSSKIGQVQGWTKMSSKENFWKNFRKTATTNAKKVWLLGMKI